MLGVSQSAELTATTSLIFNKLTVNRPGVDEKKRAETPKLKMSVKQCTWGVVCLLFT